ncbi:MAG: signal peptidase I [Deltaproteobacteria bacterium]|nr:signal peptidase I [Deltaproteobacteria bacterium]MBW2283538.1 signal peptidase I [Deltaproteobacteria bacterium]
MPAGFLREATLGEQKASKKLKKKSTLREYAEAAAIAVLLALFIRTFAVQAFKIPSGSMEPTLLVGDHILVNKFIYGVKIPFIRKTLIPIGRPDRDDVVVFIYPEDTSKDFIKRIIGLPGDRLEIIEGKILINGREYEDAFGFYGEPERRTGPGGKRNHFGPVVVPENHLFVMGDNRNHSYDSRFWGFVPMQSVKGKAFIIYWSWPHWKRFLHLID